MVLQKLAEEIFSFENLERVVFSKELLSSTLREFLNIVEIDNIKEILFRQIRFFIVKKLRNESDILNREFFNTVIYGPPGVGKSKIAKIIAKLWKSLGVISVLPSSKKITLEHEEVMLIKKNFDHLFENKGKRTLDLDRKWQSIKDFLENLEKRIKEEEIISKISHLSTDREVVICGREDFVAEYTGQTSIKTLNFLEQNIGKCIIIEESYSLCYSPTDSYGMEALTILNRWMEERKGENIFIFTGYKNMMLDTLFTFQPGLKRRFRWFFDIKGYSPQALKGIFLQQIALLNLRVSSDVENKLLSFFEREKEFFPNFGGDTERLAEECGTIHYSEIELSDVENDIISKEDFDKSFLSFKNFSAET